MTRIFFGAILLSLTFIFSCSKNTNPNSDVVGNWTWKSALSSGGFNAIPLDSNRIYSIQFKNDNSFVNDAIPVISGPPQGTYKVQNSNIGRMVILNAATYAPDTFDISVSAGKLTLSKTNNAYTWNYYFDKK
jgi:hypothetical protein